MDFTELFYALAFSCLLIVGGYQFYFIPQNINRRSYSSLSSPLDDKIPFKPGWVWIYSLGYYPFIVSPVFLMKGLDEFYVVCGCYITLLAAHVAISLWFPVKTPVEWRTYAVGTSISRRFLKFIQSVDKGGNCFPSMHVAVAVMATLHLVNLGVERLGTTVHLVWLAPAAIAASAVYTKQHFVRDLFPGFLLAVAVFVSYYNLIVSFAWQ